MLLSTLLCSRSFFPIERKQNGTNKHIQFADTNSRNAEPHTLHSSRGHPIETNTTLKTRTLLANWCYSTKNWLAVSPSVCKTMCNLPFEAWRQMKQDYIYCQWNYDIFSMACSVFHEKLTIARERHVKTRLSVWFSHWRHGETWLR